MKGRTFFLFLLASVTVFGGFVLRHFTVLAQGSGGGWDGFGTGETYPCQVCTESEASDLNQYGLDGETAGNDIPQVHGSVMAVSQRLSRLLSWCPSLLCALCPLGGFALPPLRSLLP